MKRARDWPVATIRFTCPKCGSMQKLDGQIPANASIRCSDCAAVSPLPTVAAPSISAANQAVANKSSLVPILVIGGVIVGAVLVLAMVGAVGMLFLLRGRGGSSAAGIGPSLPLPGVNPAVNQAAMQKLQPGMTPEQVQLALGAGRTSNQNDLREAFARHNETADQWSEKGTSIGVTIWYQWRNGSESIFVGFAKGRRTGKLRAVLAIWVKAL